MPKLKLELKLVSAIINFFLDEYANLEYTEDNRQNILVAIYSFLNAYDLELNNIPEAEKKTLETIFNEVADEPTELQLQKGEAEKLKNKGNTFVEKKDYYKALYSYTLAIELNPRVATYYYNRAAAFCLLNNFNAAVDDCKHAIFLQPGYGKAYGRMGYSYIRLQYYEKAVECYESASKIAPSEDVYKHNLTVAKDLVNNGLHSENSDPAALLWPFEDPGLNMETTAILQKEGFSDLLSKWVPSSVSKDRCGPTVEINALLQVSQQCISQLEVVNPELVEKLRKIVEKSLQPSTAASEEAISVPEVIDEN